MAGIAISLCDRSGRMLEPWAADGYSCWAVDVAQDQPGFRAGINFIRANVREWEPPVLAADFVSAFPPCDHLAASGARWFGEKGPIALDRALSLVRRCAELANTLTDCWMLENPVGRLSTLWRKPDYTFNPADFAGYLYGDEELAEQYTKKTCLWTGAAFHMPRPLPRPPVLGSKMHRLSQTADRKYLRSITPKGFALAVYTANAPGASVLVPYWDETF